MASPILRDGVVFVSYTESYGPTIPVNYRRDSLPARYSREPKDPDNPKSAYHDWLGSLEIKKEDTDHESPYDFAKLRKTLTTGGAVPTITPKSEPVTFDPRNLISGQDHEEKARLEEESKSLSRQENTLRTQLRSARGIARTPIKAQLRELRKKSNANYRALRKIRDKINRALAPSRLSANQRNRILNDEDVAEDVADDDEVLSDDSGLHQPAVVPTIQPGTNINDVVFNSMTQLGWRDKDEAKMTTAVLNRVDTSVWTAIFPAMKKLADELFSAIHEKTAALDEMDTATKYNFLFHVIAKGEAMYYQTIADPDFCLYLIEQSQPLYSMLIQKYRFNTF